MHRRPLFVASQRFALGTPYARLANTVHLSAPQITLSKQVRNHIAMLDISKFPVNMHAVACSKLPICSRDYLGT